MGISAISSGSSQIMSIQPRSTPPQTAALQPQKVDSDGDFDNSGAANTDRMVDIKA